MKQIEINGKKYPVRFAYKAIRGIMLDLDLTFKDFENETKVVSLMNEIHVFLFHGLKSGYKFEDREFKMSQDDIIDLIDSQDDYTQLATEIFEIFTSSMVKEEKKKKPVRKPANQV